MARDPISPVEPLKTDHARTSHGMSELLLYCYFALIVYGSLFPFWPWRPPVEPWFWGLTHLPGYISRSDLLANVLVYMPLGALFVWTRPNRRRGAISVIQATLCGAVVSFSMESLQMLLPRDSSLIDLLANTGGTLVGALVGVAVRSELRITQCFLKWKSTALRSGSAADLTLFAILIWITSQTFPFIPSLDIGTIRHSISPAWQTAQHRADFEVFRYLTYASAVLGLALLLANFATNRRAILRIAGIVLTITVLLKPLLVTRALSLEALLGAVTGVILSFVIPRTVQPGMASLFLVLLNLVLIEVSPASGPAHDFNWIPFLGEGVNVLNGLQKILELTWQPVAVAAILARSTHFRSKRNIMWWGAAGLFAFVIALELIQRYVPGRYPEITPAIIVSGTWLLVWHSAVRDRRVSEAAGGS